MELAEDFIWNWFPEKKFAYLFFLSFWNYIRNPLFTRILFKIVHDPRKVLTSELKFECCAVAHYSSWVKVISLISSHCSFLVLLAFAVPQAPPVAEDGWEEYPTVEVPTPHQWVEDEEGEEDFFSECIITRQINALLILYVLFLEHVSQREIRGLCY